MKITVREMVEMAMLVAIAVILDLPFFKAKIGANGGSVSLTMIPLFILAFRHGPIKGVIAIGVVYGIITCLLDGDEMGLLSYPFDYLIAYGSISLAGLFKNKVFHEGKTIQGMIWMTLGVLVGCVGRFVGHTLSSLIVWEYAFGPSLSYNAAYMLPITLLTIVVMLVLYAPLMEVFKRQHSRSI